MLQMPLNIHKYANTSKVWYTFPLASCVVFSEQIKNVQWVEKRNQLLWDKSMIY